MRSGYTLDDVGGVLSWDALGDFLAKTEPGSALSYELDPERARWATIDGVNDALANIYDMLASINHTLAVMATHKRQKRPEPYPRPGQKKKETKRLGSASIPISEIRNVIMKKLRGE